MLQNKIDRREHDHSSHACPALHYTKTFYPMSIFIGFSSGTVCPAKVHSMKKIQSELIFIAVNWRAVKTCQFSSFPFCFEVEKEEEDRIGHSRFLELEHFEECMRALAAYFAYLLCFACS